MPVVLVSVPVVLMLVPLLTVVLMLVPLSMVVLMVSAYIAYRQHPIAVL